jgi:hypothetical protein
MQYMLLIYQGTHGDAIDSMSEEEKQKIGAEYGAVNSSPGVTPGFPLGRPQDATTVRVENGAPTRAPGPYVSAEGAIGGYVLLEADEIDEAVAVAARIPAARLGGGIEVRPIGTYW